MADKEENLINCGLRDAFDNLLYNKYVHDLIAPIYEARHVEIFNPAEQHRIHNMLQLLVRDLSPLGGERVLDFGAGTGNLTKTLLKLGVNVVAADVSEGSLRELRLLVDSQERLETKLLNGRDLSEMVSDSFDMVVTYSVLHHVPDYLSIIDEFIRVVRPGGIIYIDHEVCPAYWEDLPAYVLYQRELAENIESEPESIQKIISNLLSRKRWWRYLVTAIYMRINHNIDEGDIHVHKHDHIEWSSIRHRLEPFCDILKEEDYLVCRELKEPPPVWSLWHDKCVDMRLVVAKKK